MFGIGVFELVIIAVAALIFIGPQKLPLVARQLGTFFVHFRRISNEVKASFDQAMVDAEIEVAKQEHEKLQKILQETSVEAKNLLSESVAVEDPVKVVETTKPSSIN